MTIWVSFLVGIAASLSTCLAVVGGIVIAFSEKYGAKEGENFLMGALRPNVKFQIGRIATFFVLGGVLGLIGGGMNFGGNFVSVYTIIIAVVMGWLGLSIVGFAPSISSLGLKTPKSVLRLWGRLEDSQHKTAPYLLGGITFFLPCGFTQSMQLLALASGSFWSGAWILSAFALGTMPVLLALGASVSWASVKKLSVFNRAAGIIVILFAVYTLNSGLALWDSNRLANGERPSARSAGSRRAGEAGIKANTKANFSEANDDPISDNAVQKIDMKITGRGFEPSVLRVKNNIPVEFAINGDGATGCTNRIVIPELDIEKDVEKGENMIKFTPKKAGLIAFSCWMGMVRGKIIVE